MTNSIHRRKYPVPARLQAHDIAGPQFAVPGRIDLDHRLALARDKATSARWIGPKVRT